MAQNESLNRLLSAVTICIIVASTGACNAPTQHTAVVDPKKARIYPTQISLTPLPDGWSQEFGLQLLRDKIYFRGSLCWIGYRKNEIGVSDHLLQTPLIQRVELYPGATFKVSNYQLPSHDPKSVDFVGYPQFNGDKTECFFRVSLLGKDYTRYEMFRWKFVTLKGESLKKTILGGNDFIPSLHGKFYAYDGEDPYSGTSYHVLAYVNGKVEIVSDQKASKGFSWTSDNHLVYATFLKQPELTKNYGYPDIYDNDLKGNVRLVKEGGYRPVFNRSKDKVAYFGPDESKSDNQQATNGTRFHPDIVGKVAVQVFDKVQDKVYFVKRVYERYPHLLWVGEKLYVIENFYNYGQQRATCRISEFDSSKHNLKVLCKLEQKGEATSHDDGKLLPYFVPIKTANGKSMLFQVPVSASGKNNYHVLAVDLATGTRSDIFSFTSSVSVHNLPLIDWIDGGQ